MTEEFNIRRQLKFTPRQEEIAREIGYLAHHNADFISFDTYNRLFNKIKLRNCKMLDMGAGFMPFPGNSSEYTKALENRNVTLVPLDIRPDKMRSWLLLDPKIKPGESHASPVIGDVFQLPFGDEVFEAIISINVFNSFESKKRIPELMHEVYRTLKTGGYLILGSFGYYEVKTERGTEYLEKITKKDIVTGEFVANIAQNAGFTKIQKIPVDSKRLSDGRQEAARDLALQVLDFKSVDIIESFGLLLKK